MSTKYEELVKRDELVYAEKCSFMEALQILRCVCKTDEFLLREQMQAIRTCNSLLYKFFSLEVHSLQEQSGFIKNILQEVNSLYVEMLRYFKFMINLGRRPTLASWL